MCLAYQSGSKGGTSTVQKVLTDNPFDEAGNLKPNIKYQTGGQCQMTYEKTSQRKKAQMNLENCRYFMLWQLTATLDSMKKNCCR